VKVGSRSSIPQSEIDRIVRGEAKPETPTGISASGKNAGNVCQIRYIQEVGEQSDEHSQIADPKDRLEKILAGYEEFLTAQDS